MTTRVGKCFLISRKVIEVPEHSRYMNTIEYCRPKFSLPSSKLTSPSFLVTKA